MKVTICACASRSLIDRERVAQVAAVLDRKGYEVTLSADLCRALSAGSPEVAAMAAGRVVACYPRAVQALFAWRGELTDAPVDIRSGEADAVLRQLGIDEPAGADESLVAAYRRQLAVFPVESGTDAWFPVLDRTRCTGCGKCHDFCLFGVYARDDRGVVVAAPEACKNNCPACARMCPSRAVIFPKYDKSPINGGLEEEESFDPAEMDALYRERLRMRLQQRRTDVSLLKKRKS